jgi:hypothetical protein
LKSVWIAATALDLLEKVGMSKTKPFGLGFQGKQVSLRRRRFPGCGAITCSFLLESGEHLGHQGCAPQDGDPFVLVED